MAKQYEPSILNAHAATDAVRTGVYQDHYSHTCVVVKVKQGKVHYLTFLDSTVQLHEAYSEKFQRDWPRELPNYPALRAIRKLAHYVAGTDGGRFSATPEARTVIRAILKG